MFSRRIFQQTNKRADLRAQQVLPAPTPPSVNPAIIPVNGIVKGNLTVEKDISVPSGLIAGDIISDFVKIGAGGVVINKVSTGSAYGNRYLIFDTNEGRLFALVGNNAPIPNPTAVVFPPTPTPGPTFGPTSTPLPTRSPTPTPTLSRTPSPSPTLSGTPGPTRTPTPTPTPSRTPTSTPRPTDFPTRTPTPTPSRTPTRTPTPTATYAFVGPLPSVTGTPNPTLPPGSRIILR